jgi:hypothetical protein
MRGTEYGRRRPVNIIARPYPPIRFHHRVPVRAARKRAASYWTLMMEKDGGLLLVRI